MQAFSRLAGAHPQAHLVFAGEGPDRPSLVQQAQALGLGGRVAFLDDLEDISILYAALDILAMPSLQEGMGLVALEAMAACLPVVASSVGGIPEVVKEGVTGLLVPPAAPAELAAALIRLLEDPILRENMGQAGRRRVVAHFSIARNVELTQNLYRELLSGL
jgi:glycosyltransferase involved in cell wall biosynthesis